MRRDLIKRGTPPLVGWMGARDPARFDIHRMDLHDDARRFQRGVHNAAGLVAAAAGLRIIETLQIERIWEHVRALSRQLLTGLRDLDLEILTPDRDVERAGIVAFRVDDAVKFNEALAARSVLAGQYLPGQIRMDVALFHEASDIQRTLEVVRQVRTEV